MPDTDMDEGAKAWQELRNYLSSKGGSRRGFFLSWLTHPAYWLVIATNLGVFFLPGLDLKTQSVTLVWIYLGQSILIGVVHVLKLMTYRFAPWSGKSNEWKSPKAIGVFFCFHYGFFHFIYAMFVPFSKIDTTLWLEGLGIFTLGLIINTIRHFNRENSGTYNANDFMFLPYVRIFPIHIAIIIGSMLAAISGNYTAVFAVLAVMKTTLELGMEYAQQLGISMADLEKNGLIGNGR